AVELSRREFGRRTLCGVAGLLAAGCAAARIGRTRDATGRVMTVTGLIEPDEMGVTLVHEHVLVDFIGAELASPERYDADAVVAKVLPQLQRIRALGCRTLIE